MEFSRTGIAVWRGELETALWIGLADTTEVPARSRCLNSLSNVYNLNAPGPSEGGETRLFMRAFSFDLFRSVPIRREA